MNTNEQLSHYIHLSKYSRYLEDEERRETWEDTLDRWHDFWVKRTGESLDPSVIKGLRDSIEQKDIMPSMRSLMTAGKALERDEVAGFNPVTGDTKVLTREYGYVPIETLSGSSATVLNKDGDWVEGSFRSYGDQEIYKVSLRKNSNTLCEVRCTGNHRWLTDDGSVKATADLNPKKDKIPYASYCREVDEGSIDYKLGCIHGLMFGDGTQQYTQERTKGYMIRVCSDIEDTLNILKGLEECKVTYPPSANGDPVVQLYGPFAKTHDLKSLPDFNEETEDYMVGFIRGWLAADGSVGKSRGSVTLCLSEPFAKWFVAHSARWGYVVQNTHELPHKTNFGCRARRTFNIVIDRSSLTSEDFLIQRKKENFRSLISRFSIVSVEKTGEREEVYCAEVPETNTFVLERGLVTGNCAAIACNHIRTFDEIFYLLMNGCGVGFSVERQYINKLPEVPEELYETETTIDVSDSKIGWAKALKELIALLYSGHIPLWDTSSVRPAGARLKTFGGRASGPEPLENLFRYVVKVFTKAAGRKLNSIESHDLICMIADTVIVGSVRRSACISLSNLTDDRMRQCKSGEFYLTHPHRSLSNNSVAYTEKPDLVSLLDEFKSLYQSKSGERGIVNKVALRKQAESCGREHSGDYLLNPCGEAILRDTGGLCNLTEVIVRPSDTLEDLKSKVRKATVLGTIQSTLVNFRYLRKVWSDNQREERLLGVSLTGIMDHPVLNGTSGTHIKDNLIVWLTELKEVAQEANKETADKLGIPRSKQLTLVKPSGTVSLLCDTSPGMHPRYSKYYLRRVTQDNKDPLTTHMKEQGVPHVTRGEKTFFTFPIEAPETSITSVTPRYQLELWKIYRDHWCEGNPSQTIYYEDDSFLSLQQWVWDNWDSIGGLSFFPKDDYVYDREIQPFLEVSKEEYQESLETFPKDIEWVFKETEDSTEGSQEFACAGDNCML